jgi:hypothetical protein
MIHFMPIPYTSSTHILRFLSNRPRDEKLPKWKEFNYTPWLTFIFLSHRTHADNANTRCSFKFFPQPWALSSHEHAQIDRGNQHNSTLNEIVRYLFALCMNGWALCGRICLAWGTHKKESHETYIEGTRLDWMQRAKRVTLTWGYHFLGSHFPLSPSICQPVSNEAHYL